MNHNGGSDSASASGTARSGDGKLKEDVSLPQRTSPLKMMVALTEKTRVVDGVGLGDGGRREGFQRLVRRYVGGVRGAYELLKLAFCHRETQAN